MFCFAKRLLLLRIAVQAPRDAPGDAPGEFPEMLPGMLPGDAPGDAPRDVFFQSEFLLRPSATKCEFFLAGIYVAPCVGLVFPGDAPVCLGPVLALCFGPPCWPRVGPLVALFSRCFKIRIP